MEYKIIPQTGEIRPLSKGAKRPKYRPIFFDFHSSMRLLTPSEVVAFLGVVQMMGKDNVFISTQATRTQIAEMTGMHYKTVGVKLKGLAEKGFIMPRVSKDGRTLSGAYFVNPYFAVERADYAFTLREKAIHYDLDGACATIISKLEEYDNKRYGAQGNVVDTDQEEDFE